MILLRTTNKEVSNKRKEKDAMQPEFRLSSNVVESSTKVGFSKNRKN